jgi:hypothetical protein
MHRYTAVAGDREDEEQLLEIGAVVLVIHRFLWKYATPNPAGCVARPSPWHPPTSAKALPSSHSREMTTIALT